MEQSVRRIAGAMFGLSGAALFVTGLLHPQGERGGGYHSTIAAFLHDPAWPVAHWLGLAAMIPFACALWLLVDVGWTTATVLSRVGSRLLLVALPFMTVEFAVELTSERAADAYAAGQVVPLVDLVEPMQAVGFPALGFGLAALALGLRDAAPRWLAVLAAIGGCVTGVGAVLVEGFHLAALGPVFAGLALPTLWMTWAGLRLALSRPATVREPAGEALPV
jgi:hypothetical protein